MAARRFKVGSRIVTFTWQLFFKNMQLYLDHELVGTVSTQEELRAGKEFKLEDGSILKLKLEAWPSTGINLYVNGRLAEGSADHSTNQSHLLFGLFLVMGCIYVSLATAHLLFPTLSFFNPFGFKTMVTGSFFVGISFYAKNSSMAAIFAAVAVFTADTFSTFYLRLEEGLNIPPTVATFKILLIFFMIRASLNVHRAQRIEIPSRERRRPRDLDF